MKKVPKAGFEPARPSLATGFYITQLSFLSITHASYFEFGPYLYPQRYLFRVLGAWPLNLPHVKIHKCNLHLEARLLIVQYQLFL